MELVFVSEPDDDVRRDEWTERTFDENYFRNTKSVADFELRGFGETLEVSCVYGVLDHASVDR